MTTTIEKIEAEQKKLANMIAELKANAPSKYGIPQALIELKAGERYAGILLDEAGEPSHHVILLPGEADDITWTAAGKWAQEAGGELPTRREQSLLFANLKGQFQAAWYWSSEQHASDSDYAWCQYFDYGLQDGSGKSAELRARAVRRLPIQ